MNKKNLLKLTGISKAFPGVQAVSEVDFSVNKGEVVSIVGQNGAGKSTLMNLVGGIHSPERGDIFIDGKKVRIPNPAIAEELGIGMVHQEPTLVPMLTVAANIFLNKEHVKKGFILNFKKMMQESNKILNTLGFTINSKRLVEEMPLVEREVVEIAKAMLLNPRILILDEVTASLGTDEVENLFELIQELKSKGMAIIFISHRLKEVIKISDRIVVLRDGEKVGELNEKNKVSEKEIINLILGNKVLEEEKKIEEDKRSEEIYIQEKPQLIVKNLSKNGYFKDVSFSLYGGEILGFAGLKGSGITEMMKAIYGILKKDYGDIYIGNKKVEVKRPKDAIKNGIGMVTNDRQKEGLALVRSVEENITISSLDHLASKFGFFKTNRLRKNATKFASALDIKIPSLKQEVLYLSGGNQQKVVISKWLLKNLDIIIVDEPTRGIDVKTKSDIHKLLVELKREGKGIIITSLEIPELLSICDRILVVVSGRIVIEVERLSNKFDEANIMEVMHVDEKDPIQAKSL